MRAAWRQPVLQDPQTPDSDDVTPLDGTSTSSEEWVGHYARAREGTSQPPALQRNVWPSAGNAPVAMTAAGDDVAALRARLLAVDSTSGLYAKAVAGGALPSPGTGPGMGGAGGHAAMDYGGAPRSTVGTAKRDRGEWDAHIRRRMWDGATARTAHQAEQIESFDGHGVDMGGSRPHGNHRERGAANLDAAGDAADGATTQRGEISRLRNSATQSMYGSQRDACIATVVTTADLAKLLPIPDDAMFLRATLPSLKRLEQHAAQLLAHVQREISLQVQDAGVSYEGVQLKTSRRGLLGSGSITAYRANMAARALVDGVARHADAAAGDDAPLTRSHVDDHGRVHIQPGMPFTARRELTFGGSSAQERSSFSPRSVHDMGASRHGRGDGAGLGLGAALPARERPAFTGVCGYTLYDDATKASLQRLSNLEGDARGRHRLVDDVHAAVSFHSPLAAAGDWTRAMDMASKGRGPSALSDADLHQLRSQEVAERLQQLQHAQGGQAHGQQLRHPLHAVMSGQQAQLYASIAGRGSDPPLSFAYRPPTGSSGGGLGASMSTAPPLSSGLGGGPSFYGAQSFAAPAPT